MLNDTVQQVRCDSLVADIFSKAAAQILQRYFIKLGAPDVQCGADIINCYTLGKVFSVIPVDFPDKRRLTGSNPVVGHDISGVPLRPYEIKTVKLCADKLETANILED